MMNVWGRWSPLEDGGVRRTRPREPQPPWAARRDALMTGLRKARPDLVAFAEVINDDDYDQVSDLLGAEYHVAHQRDREPDGSGASVASRWPLGDVQEVDLDVTPRTAGYACTTLIAEVQAPEPFGPLLFVNHSPNWQLPFEYERELQAVAAARAIEMRVGGRDVHVVLAGDMDAGPDAASMRFWHGRQSLGGMSVCYRNAWEQVHPDDAGHTFTPRNPMVRGSWPTERGRRIDHVMVRCLEHGPTLDVADCSLLLDEPVDGVWASDHFGVVADLVVAPRPRRVVSS